MNTALDLEALTISLWSFTHSETLSSFELINCHCITKCACVTSIVISTAIFKNRKRSFMNNMRVSLQKTTYFMSLKFKL